MLIFRMYFSVNVAHFQKMRVFLFYFIWFYFHCFPGSFLKNLPAITDPENAKAIVKYTKSEILSLVYLLYGCLSKEKRAGGSPS